MKKIFALAAFIAAFSLSTPVQAQIKFGLKGGLNITDMSFSNDVFSTSNRTGFFIGPSVKFTLPIVGLGIDVAALYDQREGKITDVIDEYGNAAFRTLKQKAINIPINLRYNFGLGSLAGVYVAAGPQFGFNVGDKNQALNNDGYSWKLKSSTFSVNVGAGLMLLKHVEVGANYNIVCGKTGEITVVDGVKSGLRGRSNTWQISAAYYF